MYFYSVSYKHISLNITYWAFKILFNQHLIKLKIKTHIKSYTQEGYIRLAVSSYLLRIWLANYINFICVQDRFKHKI